MAKRYEAALALPVHELQDVHALLAMIGDSGDADPVPGIVTPLNMALAL